MKFLEAQGRRPDFSRGTPPEFWLQLQDQALGEIIPDNWRFDAVIVDEGQDFEPEWFELLELFSHQKSDWLWVEDPNQKLRHSGDLDLGARGFVTFHAKANHRSPDTIARFIQKILPFEFEPANTLPGLGVGVTRYDAPEEQSALVGKTVAALIGRGFKASDIVVLSLRGTEKASLAKTDKVGRYTLRRFSGEYDLLGNQTTTDGQVVFETIYRFNGQQAPAVIVTDIDPGDGAIDVHQRLLLCAATRASVRLELIARRGVDGNRKLFSTSK